MHTPPVFRVTRTPLLGLMFAGAFALAGCGTQAVSSSLADASPSGIHGSVHGGQQPVAGAAIQLWQVGAVTAGSAASALLTQTVTSNSSGAFNITGDYTCPAANPLVFITATGGNPGLNQGVNNNIALIALLGPCANLTSSTTVNINEITTVAAAMGLHGYMSAYNAIGSSPSHVSELTKGFTTAQEIANVTYGSAPGTGIPAGSSVDVPLINTVADLLATCVNSAGGASGDNSSCGNLFALTGGAATKDTTAAVIYIAANPTNNAAALFNLLTPAVPFLPDYSSAPSSYAIAVETQVATPAISPAGGTFTSVQSVTLTDSTAGATIYYTTDGSIPTTSSTLYGAPFTPSSSGTVSAIAAASNEVNSNVATANFTILPTNPPNYTLNSQTGSSTLTFLYQSNAGFGVAGYGVTLSSSAMAKSAITQLPVQIFTCGGSIADSSSGAPAMCDGSLSADPPSPNQTVGDVVNYAVPYNTVTANNDGSYTASASITTTPGSVFNITDTYTAIPATAKFSMNRNVAVTPAAVNPEIGFNSEYAMAFNESAPAPLASDHVFAPAMWYNQNAYGAPNAPSAGMTTNGVNYFNWAETFSPMPIVMLQDPTGDVLTLGHTGPGPYGPQDSSTLPPACYYNLTTPCAANVGNYDADNNSWLVQSTDQWGAIGLSRACFSGSCTGSNPPISVSFIYPVFAINVSITGARQNWLRRSHPLVAGIQHNYTLTLTLEQDSLTTGSTVTADFPTALQNAWRTYLPLFNTPIPLLPSNGTTDGSGNAVDVASLTYQAGINLVTNQPDQVFWTDKKNSAITSVAYGFPDVYDVDPSNGADLANGFPAGDTAPSLGSQMGFTGKEMNVAYFIYRDGVLSSQGAGYPVTGNASNQTLGLNALNFWAKVEPAYEAANGYTTGLSLDWFHENNNDTSGSWDPGTCPTAASQGGGPATLPILLVKEMDSMPAMVDAAVFARMRATKQTAWETYLTNYANFLVSAQNTSQTGDGTLAGSFYRAYDAMTGAACLNDTADFGSDTLESYFPIQFLVKMYFATGNTAYSNAAIQAATYTLNNNFPNYIFVGGIPTDFVQDGNAGAFLVDATLAMYDLAKYQTSNGGNQTGQTMQTWLNLATEAGTYYETWQYVWSPKFNTNWPAYQNAGALGVLKDREGAGSGGVSGPAQTFNYYRLHLLTETTPSGHFGQWAERETYNPRLSTEFKGVTVTAYGKTYNQDFTYPLDGTVSEAVTIGDMNGYTTNTNGTYSAISGWHSWMTAGSLIGPVYLYDSFGDYSIYNLLNQVTSTIQQQQTQNVPAAPMYSDWGH